MLYHNYFKKAKMKKMSFKLKIVKIFNTYKIYQLV